MAGPPAGTRPIPSPPPLPQPPQSGYTLTLKDGRLLKVRGPNPGKKGEAVRRVHSDLAQKGIDIPGMLQHSKAEQLHQQGLGPKPPKITAGRTSDGGDKSSSTESSHPSDWPPDKVIQLVDTVGKNMVAQAAELTQRAAQPVLAAGLVPSTAVSTSPTNFIPPTTPVSGTKSETAVQKQVRSIVEQKGYKISTIEPLVKISGETGCYVTATKKTAKEERFFVPVQLNTINVSNLEEKTPNLISNSSLPDDVAQQFAGRALSAINPADVSELAQALDHKDYFSDVGSSPNEYKIWFQHTEGRIILVPCPDGRADYENAKSYVIADAKGPLTGYNLVKAALKFIEVRPNIITGVASLTIAKDTSTYSYTISTSSGITLALHSEGPELRTSSSTSKKQETISKQRRQIEFTKFENIDNMEPGKLHKYLKGSKDPRVHSEGNVGHFTAGGEADLAHNPDPTVNARAQDYIVTEDGQIYGDVHGSDSGDDGDGSSAGTTAAEEE